MRLPIEWAIMTPYGPGSVVAATRAEALQQAIADYEIEPAEILAIAPRVVRALSHGRLRV